MENNEPEKIQEAQVSEPEKISEPTVTRVRKKKREFLVELFLFFILGVLIGIAVKTEALERITMGYEDYKMKIGKQDYGINQIQKDLATENAASQEAKTEPDAPEEVDPSQSSVNENQELQAE